MKLRFVEMGFLQISYDFCPQFCRVIPDIFFHDGTHFDIGGIGVHLGINLFVFKVFSIIKLVRIFGWIILI